MRCRQVSRTPRKLFRELMLLPATPHEVALGVAVGLFASVIPLVAQSVVAVGLAAATGGCKRAALVMVWISNPLTAVPIYGFTYEVGRLFWAGAPSLTDSQLLALIAKASTGTWGDLWHTGETLVMPLVIGGLIVGLLAGVLSYLPTKWLVARRARFRTPPFAVPLRQVA